MALERIFLHDLSSFTASGTAGERKLAHTLTHFGQKEEEEDAGPPPITEEDVKAAEQEGYRKGFLEGEREGRFSEQTQQAKISEELNEALRSVAGQVERVIMDYNQFVNQSRQMLGPLALAIAKKVAGDAMQSHAHLLVEQTASACVESLLGEANIHITVHPNLAPMLEERLIALFAHRQDPSEISIIGNDNMPVSDCRIEWKHGAAERNAEQIWQHMEKLIENMGETAQRQPHDLPVTPDHPIPQQE